MRHQEKQKYLLLKMGSHLLGQRLAVFSESHQQFAERLNRFGSGHATAQTVEAMEQGDAGVSIGMWVSAWQAMQVADAVAQASKSDAALFLAAAKHAPGIEEEMASHLNKESES